jgi:hypothetical protein
VKPTVEKSPNALKELVPIPRVRPLATVSDRTAYLKSHAKIPAALPRPVDRELMPNLPFCIHSRLPLPDFDTRPKISGKIPLSGILRVFRRGLSPFRQGILDHNQLRLEPQFNDKKR